MRHRITWQNQWNGIDQKFSVGGPIVVLLSGGIHTNEHRLYPNNIYLARLCASYSQLKITQQLNHLQNKYLLSESTQEPHKLQHK